MNVWALRVKMAARVPTSLMDTTARAREDGTGRNVNRVSQGGRGRMERDGMSTGWVGGGAECQQGESGEGPSVNRVSQGREGDGLSRGRCAEGRGMEGG